MMRGRLLSLLLGGFLLASGPSGLGATAHAAGCLSAADARAAVQSGQAVALSRMLKTIRATVGGEILPPPQLCNAGGRLVYYVNVLTKNGKVARVTVDAASGSILGY